MAFLRFILIILGAQTLRIVIKMGFQVEPYIEHKHIEWKILHFGSQPYVKDIKVLIIKHRYEMDQLKRGHQQISAHPPHNPHHPVFELIPLLVFLRFSEEQIRLCVQFIFDRFVRQLVREDKRIVWWDWPFIWQAYISVPRSCFFQLVWGHLVRLFHEELNVKFKNLVYEEVHLW